MAQSIVKEDLKIILTSFKGKQLKERKILVTGGAGFLGSWLCDALIELQAKTICLDNLSTSRRDNIALLLGKKNFSFIEADVNRWRTEKKFDCIIHGASIPSPDDYVKRPVDTMLPNSLGLLSLLENAEKNDTPLLYLSTSEIYGDAEKQPTPESYWGKVNPVGQRSCYDESKRFGEALCMAYYRQHDVKVKIARIFNTYGPRIDPNARYARVIPRFIIQALKSQPITVYGDGGQTRSFCYVTDTITALLNMLENDECEGEAVNIGSPSEIAILELANAIKMITESSSQIKFQPPRPDDPKRRCPNISKAKRLLNWKPKVPLEEGLSRTVKWFKEAVC